LNISYWKSQTVRVSFPIDARSQKICRILFSVIRIGVLLNTLSRYVRAFMTALRMTIRGQQPPGLRHPELYAWIKQFAVLVAGLSAAVDEAGLGKENIIVRLDGRRLSLEKVLQIFHYQAEQEYPSLLATSANRRFNIGAIHATNMNDRFWLLILRQETSLQNAVVQAALVRLNEHLDAIPTTAKPAKAQ
jgi:hypothetical protein